MVVWDQGPRQTCNVALQVFEYNSRLTGLYKPDWLMSCAYSLDMELGFHSCY